MIIIDNKRFKMKRRMRFMSKHKPYDPDAEPVNEEHQPELLSHPSAEELIKQLNETEQKANQYWDRILRMQAEKDNLERRAKMDVEKAHKYGLEKFVAELLPIIDSLELSISNVSGELKDKAGAVIEGVELTLKMFYAAMEKFEVKQVNPLNQPFNPEFEQAISVKVDASVPAGTVVSVLQKGYTLNNRLIRPALVVVSKTEE
jgi:molecular chaperone GrpE